MSEQKPTKRHKPNAWPSILSLAGVMFILGLLGVSVLGFKGLSSYLIESSSIDLYFQDDVSQDQVFEYKKHMDHWIQGFRKASPIDTKQPVIVPGDPEREAALERMSDGIPLMDTVVDDLNQLAKQLGVELL